MLSDDKLTRNVSCETAKWAQWVLIVRSFLGPTAEIAVNRKCTRTKLAGQEGSSGECVEGKVISGKYA